MNSEEKTELIPSPRKGLNIATTVCMLGGEMIGTGVITLPYSVITSGEAGFFMITILIFLCCYGGVTLGKCWMIVTELHPEYDRNIRNPYILMGYLCYGKYMSYFVRVLVYMMQFGSAVVVLLLCSEIAHYLAGPTILNYCYWILVFAALLVPLMFLGSPKDLWQAGIVALLTSSAAGILIIGSLAYLSVEFEPLRENRPEITFNSLILGYATMTFTNSGIPVFPNVQNDMKDPRQFTKAVIITALLMLLLYLPNMSLAYFYFGESINTNVLLSLPDGAIRVTAMSMLVIHLSLAFLIIINPVAQDVEELIGIPKKFGIQRIITRVVLMLLVLFSANTVPRFSYLLDVIGGSTLPFLSLVLPVIFYMKLLSEKNKRTGNELKSTLPWYQKAFYVFLILFGIGSAIVTTYVAVQQIVSRNTFVPPCYITLQ